MSLVKDAVGAMKEVLILTDKVDRTAETLTQITKELRINGVRVKLNTINFTLTPFI